MIPTTFRCSSFRNQVVCPLPADPVSAHAPDFIAIFVHIRGILAVIRPLAWYPTKARNIDLIAGLQLYGRLRCGVLRLQLRRFDRRRRLCRRGDRNGAKLLVWLCPRRFRIFLFCRCHNIRFRGSCGVRWYWGGLFLSCVWLRSHSGAQGQASGDHSCHDALLHCSSSSFLSVKRAPGFSAAWQRAGRSSS